MEVCVLSNCGNIYQKSVLRHAKFLEVPPKSWYRDSLQRHPSLLVSRAVAVRWLWALGCGLCFAVCATAKKEQNK